MSDLLARAAGHAGERLHLANPEGAAPIIPNDHLSGPLGGPARDDPAHE